MRRCAELIRTTSRFLSGRRAPDLKQEIPNSGDLIRNTEVTSFAKAMRGVYKRVVKTQVVHIHVVCGTRAYTTHFIGGRF